jgi:sigma-B regulation protein RsbU (phosphoserine phosphatase)
MPPPPAPSLELRYHLLLDLARRVSRTLDLQDLLAHLLQAVNTAIPHDAAGVFVLNRSVPLAAGGSNLIAGMVQVGFDSPRSDDPMLRWGTGIVGHVIRTGEAVLCPDVRADSRYVEGRTATRSELAVPIVSHAGVIGALNIESDREGAFIEADGELLEFFASAAALSIEKALLHREVLQKHWMDSQLKLAREVQAGLLPLTPPDVPGWDMAATNLPTWTIGGDYYDFLPLDEGRLGLVVADVSGKGIPAALIMATFRAALRLELRRQEGLAATVNSVNRALLESQGGSRFVTAVLAVLTPTSGRLDYVNCGHNPPLLLRAGGSHDLLDKGGPALGLVVGGGFEAGALTMEGGDVLALYTDGVVEPANERQEEFGEERLLRTVAATAHLPAGDVVLAVVEATRRFARRESYDDDFTLVVVKREGWPTPP